MLAAIYGPIVLAALPRVTLAATTHPEALSRSISSGAAELLIFPAMTIAVFAAAAAMTVLVRNAVYAAILSIAAIYLVLVAFALLLGIVKLVRGEGWPDGISELSDLSPTQAAAGLLISFVASTLVAWLAVRHDWGQKSRY